MPAGDGAGVAARLSRWRGRAAEGLGGGLHEGGEVGVPLRQVLVTLARLQVLEPQFFRQVERAAVRAGQDESDATVDLFGFPAVRRRALGRARELPQGIDEQRVPGGGVLHEAVTTDEATRLVVQGQLAEPQVGGGLLPLFEHLRPGRNLARHGQAVQAAHLSFGDRARGIGARGDERSGLRGEVTALGPGCDGPCGVGGQGGEGGAVGSRFVDAEHGDHRPVGPALLGQHDPRFVRVDPAGHLAGEVRGARG